MVFAKCRVVLSSVFSIVMPQVDDRHMDSTPPAPIVGTERYDRVLDTPRAVRSHGVLAYQSFWPLCCVEIGAWLLQLAAEGVAARFSY